MTGQFNKQENKPMNGNLAVIHEPRALTAVDMRAQVNLVQEV